MPTLNETGYAPMPQKANNPPTLKREPPTHPSPKRGLTTPPNPNKGTESTPPTTPKNVNNKKCRRIH